MNKPRLTQKYGGWLCTDGSVVRWANTPEEAYGEYLKACKEVEEMVCKAKMHGLVAHIPVNKLVDTIDPVLFSGKGVGNVEAVEYKPSFRSERAYPYYDIYENENNTTDLRPFELLKVMASVAVCSFIVYLIVC